ncbi:MAG: A/G-specific adenine glycosylase [Rhodoplanes sp.]
MTLTALGRATKPIRPTGLSPQQAVQNLGRRLLAWYDRNRRDLPWRAWPGKRSDPYRVWVSEIMLQQTTVAATIPYYQRFLARFPTVHALAAADVDEALRLWAGLGYYARARNLHACARAVVERHDGHFPQKLAALRALPGIGDYTAAAIAAIAFDEPVVPIDGNVERVVARLFAIGEALPRGKPAIRRAAERLAPRARAGDFAQALMDLGATLCTPKSPGCPRCPLRADCAANRRGDPEAFPVKEAKRQGRLRRGAAFVVLRDDGCLLVRTRPANGLLGGMTEVPTTEWTHSFDEQTALAHAPVFPRFTGEDESESGECHSYTGGKLSTPCPDPPLNVEKEIAWRRAPGVVRHVFTHFPLDLIVFVTRVPALAEAPAGMRWVACADLDREALPNLIRKVIGHADIVLKSGSARRGAGRTIRRRQAR